MPVKGAEVVTGNIKIFGGGFLKHVNKTMIKVKDMLDKQVTFNMTFQDHNLSYLRKMGHPYAKKHGPEGMHIHDPYWVVHKQSGQLLASKKSGTYVLTDGSHLKAVAEVGLNPYEAEHAIHVIWGTSKMIPRDFLTGSLMQVKDKAFEVLHSNLRDMVFNFRGVQANG